MKSQDHIVVGVAMAGASVVNPAGPAIRLIRNATSVDLQLSQSADARTLIIEAAPMLPVAPPKRKPLVHNPSRKKLAGKVRLGGKVRKS